MRVRWIVMLSSGMPSVRETSPRPPCGVCDGAQISILPSLNSAVQFCGSSDAWAMKG